MLFSFYLNRIMDSKKRAVFCNLAAKFIFLSTLKQRQFADRFVS
jgi:hypothetical protein